MSKKYYNSAILKEEENTKKKHKNKRTQEQGQVNTRPRKHKKKIQDYKNTKGQGSNINTDDCR